MVVGLDFVLSGVNQETGCGRINPAIVFMNYVVHLTVTVVSHDSNNN